jgi:DNA-binding transcriptional MerR regulator
LILNKKTWKVGELARQTGLTIRMLHHYDKIGLFSPSQTSDKGYRIYTETNIAKLQQIMSLKQLGFALNEIKEMIENPNLKLTEHVKVLQGRPFYRRGSTIYRKVERLLSTRLVQYAI